MEEAGGVMEINTRPAPIRKPGPIFPPPEQITNKKINLIK